MELDLSCIEEYFPMADFREGQRETIEKVMKAFDSGKRVVILEGPTGTGKSAIGYTVARYFDTSYYITIQKSLQSQLMGDFGVDDGQYRQKGFSVVDLKGRNNYECLYYKTRAREPKPSPEVIEKAQEYIACDAGECIRQGESKLDECFGALCTCPYLARKAQAKTANVCLMNFSSFFFQFVFGGFSARQFMIVDEAHNVEQQILNFVGLRISDIFFKDDGVEFPKYETVIEYLVYFQKIGLMDLVEQKVEEFKRQNEKDAAEWERRKWKLGKLLDMLESGQDPDDRWAVNFHESGKKMIRTLEFKPVFSSDFAERFLLGAADQILMMSATILSPQVIRRSLGLKKDEVTAIRMKNRFPVSNRRIIYSPSGSLSFKNKRKSFPAIANAVDAICSEHKDCKGIIHTHNFELCYKLFELCDGTVKKRFLFQKDWPTKEDMLVHHRKPGNTIILAPAMHEGLDLYDELSRFQIIVKVPYPSRNDKQLMARTAVEPEYYDWLTALKLVQAYGRSVRSPEDWAVTYIIDSDFSWFKKKCRQFLPTWFMEAIEVAD